MTDKAHRAGSDPTTTSSVATQITAFALSGPNILTDQHGDRIKADGKGELGWRVMYRPTRAERWPVLFEHAKDADAASVIAFKLAATMIAAGRCGKCSHEHIGKCESVNAHRDGFEEKCPCLGVE